MVRRTEGRHNLMGVGDVDRVIRSTGVTLTLEKFGAGHWDIFFDLVQVSPVSETTVVKKTINEGVFGPVSVLASRDGEVQLNIAPKSNGSLTWYSKDDLRETIDVLTKLVDALEAA